MVNHDLAVHSSADLEVLYRRILELGGLDDDLKNFDRLPEEDLELLQDIREILFERGYRI